MAKNHKKKNCKTCGEEFKPKTGNQVYCTDCGLKRPQSKTKAYNKARMKRWDEISETGQVETPAPKGVIDKCWPWRTGDKLQVVPRLQRKEAITGRVVEIYDNFLVLQLDKYRTTLLKVDWLTGQVKAKKVG